MRGVFAYPPGGHVPWHTNVLSEPGFRAYFSYHLAAPNGTDEGQSEWARSVFEFYKRWPQYHPEDSAVTERERAEALAHERAQTAAAQWERVRGGGDGGGDGGDGGDSSDSGGFMGGMGGVGGVGASFRWFDYREGVNRQLPLQHGDVVVFAAERKQPLWHTTYSDGILRISLGLLLPAEEVMELYKSGALLDARQFASIDFG